jgi:hypothetical protein
VSALVCSPTRACACVHRLDRKTYGLSPQVRESGQEKQGFGPAVVCMGMVKEDWALAPRLSVREGACVCRQRNTAVS